jgi:hypothetical protein
MLLAEAALTVHNEILLCMADEFKRHTASTYRVSLLSMDQFTTIDKN